MNIFQRIGTKLPRSGFAVCVALAFALLVTPALVLAAHVRVNLLTADNFAVLAGSAISDTGTSVVVGDVGLSPTGGASITGLTCVEVTGTIYDTNAGYSGGGGGSTACLQTNSDLLVTAKNDLVTAYNDAAGRTVTAHVPTQLGGTTLTDGTYDSADGTFGLTGTLTLDGGGNADSVFIFKMDSTLVTASSSQVVLTNGAQACNVYWQVGSSATLGTSSNFVGNILALTSITDNGGSTVRGRLLAQDGAVTLNNTTLTRQFCSTPSITPSSSSNPGAGSTAGTGSTTNAPGARACPVLNYISPIIIDSTRVDSDSVSLTWGPYSGIDTFNVRYGFASGDWQYNTTVTGFSTTLNDLPAFRPIWVQVAATDNCSIGTYGPPFLAGGPILPNSGYATPEDQSQLSRPNRLSLLLSFFRTWFQE